MNAVEEQAVEELLQAVGLLVRRVRAVSAGQGLSFTEAMVLARLAREGAKTVADLARAEGVRPQSMGTSVATLEELGLVERKPHPTDGRQMLVSISQKGLEERTRARGAKRTWLGQVLAELSEQECETLFASVGILRRMAEK